MRRRDPDELTDREREVHALLRRDFTNEQIAQRLGISLDGAKYHVSQILSKLGVATREEAAAVSLGERRRWWAAWPLWAKIAGAATVVAAAAGLAVLVWGVLGTEEGEDQSSAVSDLTTDDLYDRVEQAITRPGFVLHSTIEIQRLEGEGFAPNATIEIWADTSGERIRWGGAWVGLLVGDTYYSADGTPQPTIPGRPCPGTESYVVSGLLLCDAPVPNSSNMSMEARVEPNAEYQGESSAVFGLDLSETELVPAALVNPTTGPVPPTESLTPLKTTITSRTHIATETFLPQVRLYEIRQNGETTYDSAWIYEHEFIPIGDLGADFFDPASLEDVTQSPPAP